MALQILQKDLFSLLQKACPVAPAKSSLQILSNIKLCVHEGTIDVVATDLDHSIQVQGSIEGSDVFEVAINARKAFDLVREIPEGMVGIDVDENVVSLISEKGFSCKVAGTDVRDYPDFPQIEESASFSVTASDMKRMVQRSVFAVSKDSSRSCLCGVNWVMGDGSMTMVATDGHRLGRCTLPTDHLPVEPTSAIISPKSLIHMCRSIDSEPSSSLIHVSLGSEYVVFSLGTLRLCSKLIDGPYPDYEKVIPRENPKAAVIDRSMLVDAVRRVSILSNQKTHLVKFSFLQQQLEIVVLNRDIGGEAREVLPAEYEGEQHSIGLNAHFLNEILGIIDSPRVRFEMNTQISACLIYPVHEEALRTDDLFLIMPLRIMDELL